MVHDIKKMNGRPRNQTEYQKRADDDDVGIFRLSWRDKVRIIRVRTLYLEILACRIGRMVALSDFT